MENMKIRTYGIKELSEKVQRELFRLGCAWASGNRHYYDHIHHIIVVKSEVITSSPDYLTLKEVTLQDLIDMPTPVVFEVKADCEHKAEDAFNYCEHKDEVIGQCSGNISCHACTDYEKKKRVVRYWAEAVHNVDFEYKLKFKTNEELQTKGLTKQPIKVCPDTHRIYIEVEQ